MQYSSVLYILFVSWLSDLAKSATEVCVCIVCCNALAGTVTARCWCATVRYSALQCATILYVRHCWTRLASALRLFALLLGWRVGVGVRRKDAEADAVAAAEEGKPLGRMQRRHRQARAKIRAVNKEEERERERESSRGSQTERVKTVKTVSPSLGLLVTHISTQSG